MVLEQKKVSIVLVLLTLCLFACEEQTKKNGAPLYSVDITTIKNHGKSVDWLFRENLIATARQLYDGYYDVVVFSMDDPENETWLTHNTPGAPGKHNGNPAWHPSGEYIVFTAENEDLPEQYDDIAKPGRGVNCNLWLAEADGSDFYQLTDYRTRYWNARAVIHPQFSHDGTRLFWAERIADDAGTYWGKWVMKTADFIDDGFDHPHLDNIQTFDPGEQSCFYESHGFSLDDNSIMFAGNLLEGQHETGMDIYELDVYSGNLTQLTASLSDWDEHAHRSPDGTKIAWMSSAGLDVEFPEDMGPLDWRYYLATELWIMDADGANKQRLTFYNDPNHLHHKAPRTAVSDSAWSPDGNSLIVLVAHYDGTGPDSRGRTELVLVTLSQN